MSYAYAITKTNPKITTVGISIDTSCAADDNSIKYTNDNFIKCTNNFLMKPNDKAKYGGSFRTISGKEIYIKQVLYTAPATVVWWSDGTQTKDICPKSAEYNPDSGLAFCVLKKLMGNDEVGKLFNDWEMPNVNGKEMRRYISLSDVRAKHKK